MKARFVDDSTLKADFKTTREMQAGFGSTTLIETADYNKLSNKPTINAVTVEGHKTGIDYNLQNKMQPITEHDIDVLIYGGNNNG